MCFPAMLSLFIYMHVCMHLDGQVTVEGNEELQVVLVELLVFNCGLQVAAQWANRYNVPRERLPIGVWDTMKSLSPEEL